MMVTCGNFFFRFRDFLFPLVFVILAVAFRPAYPMDVREYDRVTDALGLAMAISGQALRAAVIGYAYVKRGGKNKHVYADTLVTEGFFNHSRNPLYVGNLLILAGLIVIHGSPWVIGIGGAFYLFAYLAITAAEEDFLGKKFGAQYEDYCKRVPRFIPRFAGLGKSIEGMNFDWQRLIRKEYGSTFVWIVCALALYWWEQYVHYGLKFTKHRIITVAVILAPLAVAYVAARILKKTGRLGKD
jgi:protein-S-isoprenylcysteine O-methyltransferase Ste14